MDMLDNTDKYNSKFATRLRELMKSRKVTQQSLATEINVTRQAISQYTDGSVLPNIEKLEGMSDFFNVSCDYLLGKTDVLTSDTNIKEINKLIGLNEKVIKNLIELKESDCFDALDWLNTLLSGNVFSKDSFFNLIFDLDKYQALFYNYKLYEEKKSETYSKIKGEKHSSIVSKEYYKRFEQETIDYPKILVAIESSREPFSSVNVSADIAQKAIEKSIEDQFMNIINTILHNQWEVENSKLICVNKDTKK